VNAALFTPIGGTSIYSTGTIPVAPGAHSLLGAVPFSALVYDFGISLDAVSYAYPVATKLSWPAAAVTLTPTTTVCGTDQQNEDQQNRQAKDQNSAKDLDHPSQTGLATPSYQGAENDDGQECH